MLGQESEEHGDRSGYSVKCLNDEFYTAIMEEDEGRVRDMANKYGSNFFIHRPGCAPGGLATFPLHLAASSRKVKSVQSLLSTGVDTEMRTAFCDFLFHCLYFCHRDRMGRTPLHSVIASWPTSLDPKHGSKFQAAAVGQRVRAETCLQLLCEHGSNVNAEVEGSPETALHLMVRYLALSAVHILTSHGAKVNAVDCNGMTPLHMAAGILQKDIMTSLIKEGADVNMRVTHSGNTPLHMAAVSFAVKTSRTPENAISCISELLEHGAEIDPMNNIGRTPLQEVCIMANEELVDLLLRNGANINKMTKAGENCLFLLLNNRPNVRNSSLLGKLLSLTSPLTVYNRDGHLPNILMQRCFSKQRDQLLKLTKRPRRLMDICKSHIYLKYVQGRREELRKLLPNKLFDFVFDHWEKKISFVTEGDHDC